MPSAVTPLALLACPNSSVGTFDGVVELPPPHAANKLTKEVIAEV
jgi:hypothetical protein